MRNLTQVYFISSIVSLRAVLQINFTYSTGCTTGHAIESGGGPYFSGHLIALWQMHTSCSEKSIRFMNVSNHSHLTNLLKIQLLYGWCQMSFGLPTNQKKLIIVTIQMQLNQVLLHLLLQKKIIKFVQRKSSTKVKKH